MYQAQQRGCIILSIFRKKVFVKGIVIAAILFVLAVITILFTPSNSIPVLSYHQINDKDLNPLTVSTSEFDAQMKYLSENGYHTISPAQLISHLEDDAPLPDKPIVITFDDGYKDNYQNAFPILQKYHQNATIFLISDYVNNYEKYLTWEQINEMQQYGIDFESHTLSHMVLTEAKSDDELNAQLVKSKEALEWRLGKKIEYIAYPCGNYNRHIIELTKAAGYKGAFTVNFGRSKVGDPVYALDRVPVFGCNSHTYLRFRLRLKCTQIFAPLQTFKTNLIQNNHPFLARLIWVP